MITLSDALITEMKFSVVSGDPALLSQVNENTTWEKLTELGATFWQRPCITNATVGTSTGKILAGYYIEAVFLDITIASEKGQFHPSVLLTYYFDGQMRLENGTISGMGYFDSREINKCRKLDTPSLEGLHNIPYFTPLNNEQLKILKG